MRRGPGPAPGAHGRTAKRPAAGVRMPEFRTPRARTCCDRRMDALRVRPATPDGIGSVPAFRGTAAKGTSISDDRDGVARLIARDPKALLPAEQDGEPAGTAGAGFDGRRCHLYRPAVRPGRRRRGIGSALPRAAEQRFAGLGGRRADAMVLTRDETAHRAWRAAGYRPEEQWRRWVRPLAD
ncbi:GNAT family N-acetyltransferase [Streptomyces thermogriseus]|uniref:GNAT family N-acetyltransferase n=2 Tax=Streptomyces TaxID=1883 RepID=A0ABN1SV11_9ACTN